jgi:hypothetical protein
MMSTEIVLYEGGTAQQTVDLMTWDFDLSTYILMTRDESLQRLLEALQETMAQVIGHARSFGSLPLPATVDVPDLWHHALRGYAAGDALEMFSAVGAARFIAEQYYGREEILMIDGIRTRRFSEES